MSRWVFDHEFVGYKNLVVAIPYRSKNSIPMKDGKPVENLDRVTRFKLGIPIYLSPLGSIRAITYRLIGRKDGYDSEQDVILGIGTPGHQGILLEFDAGKMCVDRLPIVPDSPVALDFSPREILPIYLKGDYASQERGNPDSVLVAGDGGLRLVRLRWNQAVPITLNYDLKGNFMPTGFEVDKNRGKILAVGGFLPEEIEDLQSTLSPSPTTPLNLFEVAEPTHSIDVTDQLHRTGVDIELTMENIENYRRWKREDDIF